jgi:hypothetical protein
MLQTVLEGALIKASTSCASVAFALFERANAAVMSRAQIFRFMVRSGLKSVLRYS